MLFLILTFIGCNMELPIFKKGNGDLYEQGTSVSNAQTDDSQQDTSTEEPEDTGEEPEDTGESEDTSTNQ